MLCCAGGFPRRPLTRPPPFVACAQGSTQADADAEKQGQKFREEELSIRRQEAANEASRLEAQHQAAQQQMQMMQQLLQQQQQQQQQQMQMQQQHMQMMQTMMGFFANQQGGVQRPG